MGKNVSFWVGNRNLETNEKIVTDCTIVLRLLVGLCIPFRLQKTVARYLLSLMVPCAKHTQTFAARLSGCAANLFSNLLGQHLELSELTLNRAAKRRMAKLMRVRKKLDPDAPWTVLILIDSTLHTRHSKRCNNAQKLTHGKGWTLGHQWTNIGIVINGQYTPLPPIPFYTKEECRARNIRYQTEHEKVTAFLRDLNLDELLGQYDPSEILLQTDSGYDDKKILTAIRKRGWHYNVSIKASRKVKGIKQSIWQNITHAFTNDSPTPFSITTDGNKIRTMILSRLENARLSGVMHDVKLVRSKRSSDQKVKYLACSNLDISAETMVICYVSRWDIEIFHRDIKSYLGLQDAGVHSFDSLNAHVHWVCLAYILLQDLDLASSLGIQSRQQYIQNQLDISKHRRIINLATRFSPREQIMKFCISHIERLAA